MWGKGTSGKGPEEGASRKGVKKSFPEGFFTKGGKGGKPKRREKEGGVLDE